MLLKGNLAEEQLIDVLQFINASKRSGSLTLTSEKRRGVIVFKDGDVVMATVEGSQDTLGSMLVERGIISAENISRALDAQRSPMAGVPLGQILVRMGLITNKELRTVVEDRIRNAIYDMVPWSDGEYLFNDHEMTMFGDFAVPIDEIMPDVHLDTQLLIVESVKIFDERDKRDPKTAIKAIVLPPPPAVEGPPPIPSTSVIGKKPPIELEPIYLLSEDEGLVELVRYVAERNNCDLTVFNEFEKVLKRVRTAADSKNLPTVVLDECFVSETAERGAEVDPILALVTKLTRRLPDAGIVIVGAPKSNESRVRLMEKGVRAFVPPPSTEVNTPLGITKSKDLFKKELWVQLNNIFAYYDALELSRAWSKRAESLESYFLKIRKFIKDSRQSNISFMASLDLLNLIAENYERAMMFLVRPDSLVGIGGFGIGKVLPLGIAAKRISIPLSEDSVFRKVYESATTFIGVPDEVNSWHKYFYTFVGRPVTAEAMVIPLLSDNKVVAVVYCDNGDKDKSMEYDELLDLLSNQTRILYETMLMERLPQPG